MPLSTKFPTAGLFFLLIVSVALIARAEVQPIGEPAEPDQVKQLQWDLIWTGHLEGLADGVLGKGTHRAMERFQAMLGADKATSLTPAQRSALRLLAEDKRNSVGFQILETQAGGVRIGLPVRLIQWHEVLSDGVRASSADGSIQIVVFEALKSRVQVMRFLKSFDLSTNTEDTVYRVDKPSLIVRSAGDGQTNKYFMAVKRQDRFQAFFIAFPVSQGAVLGRIVTAMASSFRYPASQNDSIPDLASALDAARSTQDTKEIADPSRKVDQTGGPCHSKNSASARLEVIPIEEMFRIGDSKQISWRISSPRARSCSTVLYLVLSSPSRIRFEGNGFFALAPDATGPFGLPWKSDETRIFIPLPRGETQLEGQLGIIPVLAGEQVLSWNLLEIEPSDRLSEQPVDPPVYHAFMGQDAAGQLSFEAESGFPRIVVQDRYFVGKPERTIYSNSDEYELRIYDGYFEVVTSDTRDIVVQDQGWRPNFSPTSRFLAAYTGPTASLAARIKIFDLWTGQKILQSMHANTPDAAVVWAHRDSFAIIDKGGWGGFEFVQPLIDDRRLMLRGEYSGRFIPAIATATLRLSIENASLEVAGEFREEILVMSLLADQKELEKITGTTADYDVQQQLEDAQSRRWIRKHRRLYRPTIAHDPEAGLVARWQLGDRLQVSHLLDILRDALDFDLRTMEIAHQIRPTDQSTDAMLRTADSKIGTSIRGAMLPKHDAALDSEEAVAPSLAATEDEWRKFGIRLRSMDGGQVFAPPLILGQMKQDSPWGANNWFNMVINQQLEDVAPELVEAVDDLRATSRDAEQTIVRYSGSDNPCFGYWEQDEQTEGETGEKKHELVAETISQLWRWRQKEETTWLVHALCYTGTTGSGPPEGRLFLYRTDKMGRSPFVDVGEKLPKDFYLSPASFQDPRPLAAWIDNNRLLLASKTSNSVAIMDLVRASVIHHADVLTRSSNLHDLRLDETGQFVVQRNRAVESFLIGLAAAQVILSAVEIDGEVIVFDTSGYFQGTEESSSYVFLKFPGVGGHHAIRQFRRILHRPDRLKLLVDRYRSGLNVQRSDADRGLSIAAPPVISMRSIGAATADAVPLVRITASSQSGLNVLRIYGDGALSRTVAISGTKIDMTIDLTQEMREEYTWIAVNVEDNTGVEGLAKVLSISDRQVSASRKLHVIAVGTDKYVDPQLAPLDWAVSDAENIVSAMERMAEGVYASVTFDLLTNADELQREILNRIAQANSELVAGDTLLVHVAAHGIRDDSGKFYFAARSTQMTNVAATAISWEQLAAAVSNSKARVVILLDTCHSGAAGAAEVNEGAVSALGEAEVPILILAASKGRQLSREDRSAGGGLFSATLVKLLSDRKRLDQNNSGRLEFSEIYYPLKRIVSELTKGQQTPWVSRNSMIGEIPLF